RQCLRFGDAGGEGVPGHNGLDGGERIAAALLGLNQRLLAEMGSDAQWNENSR
ncbi:hypothetical protein ABZM66_005776, partial [Citrobacter freundii]